VRRIRNQLKTYARHVKNFRGVHRRMENPPPPPGWEGEALYSLPPSRLEAGKRRGAHVQKSDSRPTRAKIRH
jgi:hypothetical protein